MMAGKRKTVGAEFYGGMAPGERFQQVPRPVSAVARDYPPDFYGSRHSHPRAQLMHSTRGSMLVLTPGRSWVVLPNCALWIPHGIEHEMHGRHAMSLRSIYVVPDACAWMGTECRLIGVTKLLSALLDEASQVPAEYDLEGRDGRLMRLLVDEVARTAPLPPGIAIPRAGELASACREMLRAPGRPWSLDDVAVRAGMSRRSLTRTFRQDVGCSFSQWLGQVRMRDGMARLQGGQPVTHVALDLGYSSPSAFTAAFRRAFGLRPSEAALR